MRAVFLFLILSFSTTILKAQDLIPYREGDKYGWVNINGKVVIKARFDKTFPLSDGLARFSYQNRFGYINEKGQTVIGNNFLKAYDFKDGMARVKDGPVWGFIDKRGRKLFTVKAEDVEDFHNGAAIYKRQGFYGYINKKGEEISPAIFTSADLFENNRARVKVGRYFGLIDKKGKFVLELKYDFIGSPKDSFIRAKTGGLWFIYTIRGKKLTKSPYPIVGDFGYGLAKVRVKDESQIVWYNYIDARGDLVIEKDFSKAGRFNFGRAVTKYEGKFGVIDKNGNWIKDPIFEKSRGIYQEEMLGVMKENRWGFIGLNGKTQVPFKYSRVEDFNNGFAMVAKGPHQWGLVNKEGKEIVPTRYDLVMAQDYFIIAILGYYKSYYTLDGDLIWEDKPDEE